MARMRKTILTIAAMSLALPSVYTVADEKNNSSHNTAPKTIKYLATNSEISTQAETSSAKSTILSGKDEVVYGNLSATGRQKELYVVNTLEVNKDGLVVDYGNYNNLKNLTDLAKISQDGDRIEIEAGAGKFFYQGTLENKTLPWEIDIKYFLNGKEVNPTEMAGKDGKVEIELSITPLTGNHKLFVENYLLQISIPLDGRYFSNIVVDDGMVANVGKNKQVTFTVMPNSDAKFTMKADVEKFQLDGIDISGIPSSIAVDEPNVAEMKDDMTTLSTAIGELNDGVGQLNSGVNQLNNGTKDLEAGSEQYKSGLDKINSSAPELLSASAEIKDGLQLMSGSEVEAGDVDASEISQFSDGLKAIAAGLRETVSGLENLQGHYSDALTILDNAIGEIPETQIPEEEIQKLYKSGVNQAVLNQLVEGYTSSQKVKYIYGETKQVFAYVEPTLSQVIAGLTEMATNLEMMANELDSSLGQLVDSMNGLEQLFASLNLLATNYNEFHNGLSTYISGVGKIAQSYDEIHNGITQLSAGTTELATGTKDLQAGTQELHKSTEDLPDQMQKEIDKMMADYDKSDFEPKSFVSEKNTKVNSVQFVFKTEAIKIDESKESEQPEKKKQGFWSRLLNLFKRN